MRNSPIKSIKNPDKIKNYWIKEKKSVILLTLFGILYDVGMVARPIYQGKLIDALIAKVNFNNLIKLSLADHILAHYYLCFCTKNGYDVDNSIAFIKMSGLYYKNIEEKDLIKIYPKIIEAR